jgi:hypothetical protein
MGEVKTDVTSHHEQDVAETSRAFIATFAATTPE